LPLGRVAKLVIIGGIPPILLKAPANPGGLPMELFDGLRKQLADQALRSVKLLKKGTLKVYEKLPHGMCTTHADMVNPELLEFIKG
jgi:hypothetical protein